MLSRGVDKEGQGPVGVAVGLGGAGLRDPGSVVVVTDGDVNNLEWGR